MILLYIGLNQGWANLVDSAELAEDAAGLATTAQAQCDQDLPPPAEGGGVQPRVGVSRSSGDMEALRKTCHNYQHLCYMILEQPLVARHVGPLG